MATLPEPPVGEHGLSRIMARRARNTAPRARTGAAQIETLQGHAVVCRTDHRPRAEQLVQPHLAVENVAADQPKAALEIERRMKLAAEHRFGKTRRMRVDRGDNLVRRLLPLLVPVAAGTE